MHIIFDAKDLQKDQVLEKIISALLPFVDLREDQSKLTLQDKFGWINFNDEASARNAREALNGKDVLENGTVFQMNKSKTTVNNK